jgi:hypothetical protein
LDDFHIDAEVGGMLDEVLAVVAVEPDLADGGVGGGGLRQGLVPERVTLDPLHHKAGRGPELQTRPGAKADTR